MPPFIASRNRNSKFPSLIKLVMSTMRNMDQSPKRYRRRIFLINRPFQVRFSLYVCSWLVTVSAIYPWLVYQLFNWFVRMLQLDQRAPAFAQFIGFRTQMVTLLIIMQAVFIAMIFLIS